MIYSLDTAVGSTDQENAFGSLSRIFLANKANIASIISADKAKVDTLTMVTGALFHEVKFLHDTGNYIDDYKVTGTDQYWEHSLNFTLKGHDQATIVSARKLALGQNYVAIVQRMSGQWFVLGSSIGLNASVYTANAVADANGRTFTLAGKNGTNALLIDEATALALVAPIV